MLRQDIEKSINTSATQNYGSFSWHRQSSHTTNRLCVTYFMFLISSVFVFGSTDFIGYYDHVVKCTKCIYLLNAKNEEKNVEISHFEHQLLLTSECTYIIYKLDNLHSMQCGFFIFFFYSSCFVYRLCEK